MVLIGLAIVSPCLIGAVLDYVAGNREPVLTFIGGFCSICELAERVFERAVNFATQAVCPNKFAGYENLELLDEEE